MPKNILIIGATGYVGGSVLSRFLERPDIGSLHITALIRSPEKAAKFVTFGVKPIVGSLTDSALVEQLASQADVVLSVASSYYLPAIEAILKGLEKCYKATGAVSILIHTSGTRVLSVLDNGEYPTDTIYDDSNPDQIETLSISPFRKVDVELDAADAKGYVKTYIILPSLIYGTVSNKLTEAGIQNSRSILIPRLADAAVDRGQTGTFGSGKNLWNNVHNDDLADLYLVLYDSLQANPSGTGHGREGYYFGENGTHSYYGLSKAIGLTLVELGRSKSPEPTPFTQEEIDKDFPFLLLGASSRAIGKRSRAIGWRPKHTTEDLYASVKADVEASIKN